MKISISAVGRLRKSPEKELIDDYLSRFSKLAKPFGLSLNPIIEIEDKKGGGPKTEAQLLAKHFQKNSKIIAPRILANDVTFFFKSIIISPKFHKINSLVFFLLY